MTFPFTQESATYLGVSAFIMTPLFSLRHFANLVIRSSNVGMDSFRKAEHSIGHA
jgi:hypothetical protein